MKPGTSQFDFWFFIVRALYPNGSGFVNISIARSDVIGGDTRATNPHIAGPATPVNSVVPVTVAKGICTGVFPASGCGPFEAVIRGAYACVISSWEISALLHHL